jgi:hypothetical protein
LAATMRQVHGDVTPRKARKAARRYVRNSGPTLLARTRKEAEAAIRRPPRFIIPAPRQNQPDRQPMYVRRPERNSRRARILRTRRAPARAPASSSDGPLRHSGLLRLSPGVWVKPGAASDRNTRCEAEVAS